MEMKRRWKRRWKRRREKKTAPLEVNGKSDQSVEKTAAKCLVSWKWKKNKKMEN